MTALVEFLAARVAEDQAAAEQAAAGVMPGDTPGGEWFANLADSNGDSIVAMYPARALAEVATKRAVVEWYRKVLAIEADGHVTEYSAGERGAVETVARRVASIYSEHPDYGAAIS